MTIHGSAGCASIHGVGGDRARRAWGMEPRAAGETAPRSSPSALRGSRRAFGVSLCAALGATVALSAVGCASKSEDKAYDPVALGMLDTDAPFYDDGETQIYAVKRPVSLPILTPTDNQRATLVTPVPPYERTPWITKSDVKVQVTWTLSNLDRDPHNVEILLDPWNEFARYVPAVNVGDEEVVPDLSGIDLLLRVDGLQRRTGTFTFDDMAELATDLATVQNIIVSNPQVAGPPMPGMGPGVNGMINHAFDLHNRSSDPDPLIGAYVPATVAGLVGFDLGLRSYGQGTVAIEIMVEVVDATGNRVIADQPLRIDGTMWMTPDAELSAPMGDVR